MQGNDGLAQREFAHLWRVRHRYCNTGGTMRWRRLRRRNGPLRPAKPATDRRSAQPSRVIFERISIRASTTIPSRSVSRPQDLEPGLIPSVRSARLRVFFVLPSLSPRYLFDVEALEDEGEFMNVSGWFLSICSYFPVGWGCRNFKNPTKSRGCPLVF